MNTTESSLNRSRCRAPVLAEKKRRLSRLRGRGCGICRHGVISAGAPTPVMAWGTSRRLRRPHIPTTAPTAPRPNNCPTKDRPASFTRLVWNWDAVKRPCVVESDLRKPDAYALYHFSAERWRDAGEAGSAGVNG